MIIFDLKWPAQALIAHRNGRQFERRIDHQASRTSLAASHGQISMDEADYLIVTTQVDACFLLPTIPLRLNLRLEISKRYLGVLI